MSISVKIFKITKCHRFWMITIATIMAIAIGCGESGPEWTSEDAEIITGILKKGDFGKVLVTTDGRVTDVVSIEPSSATEATVIFERSRWIGYGLYTYVMGVRISLYNARVEKHRSEWRGYGDDGNDWRMVNDTIIK